MLCLIDSRAGEQPCGQGESSGVALAVMVILAGTGGRAPEISIRGQRMELPQGAPPKLTEAPLVKVSGVCHWLLVIPTPPRQWLRVPDSVAVSVSARARTRTREPGPAHAAAPARSALVRISLCSRRGPSRALSCFIHSAPGAGGAVILSLSARPQGRGARPGSGEMAHLTCLSQ